jgi:hypothetical protein
MWQCIVLCLLAPTLFGQKCAVISQPTSDRLAQYVHDKFGFAPNTQIILQTAEIAAHTCYRKIQFGYAKFGQPFHVFFYLSPDQKFLTRDLLDTAV